MLGQSAGLSGEQIAHLGDDPLPDGLYDAAQRAVVVYTRASTRMATIDDALYAELERHFDRKQIMELCFEVGLANLVNRFHATFLTDVDATTCALPLPDPIASAADQGWQRSRGGA